ncbi:Rv2231c family pyridoxal phosphate-dependent protein CobC [Actinokineospora sp. HUAS TT18]|uniref:Rv2231c family pyridoxal phosphate-dependent protein CobC n=1 Tax=Actinokineospora sp. HUAS TT18 TaxID=3447451 RepID=UPI003F527132
MTSSGSDEYALLRHHGDVDAAPGLLDFAVNVRGTRPPEWLRDRLAAAIDRLGTYPSAADDLAAREAVAARHRREPDHVMILNGSAEGFALLPRLRPTLAALIHPSFTEPEVALRAADVPVHRVQLDAADGYALHPERVPDEADLVVLGNPTNPTSTLHPRAAIRALARPGRVLLVDEAFMDAVPGEPESLADDAETPGLLVFRSLTKTWAVPGLRAGYALAAPGLLAGLGVDRPQWPVGTLVLEAVEACSEPRALLHSESGAVEIAEHRLELTTALRDLGIEVNEPASAPYLLIKVPHGERVREGLRRRGIAVRRADTFPGLGPDHLRIAVRDQTQCAPLLAALTAELAVEVTR